MGFTDIDNIQSNKSNIVGFTWKYNKDNPNVITCLPGSCTKKKGSEIDLKGELDVHLDVIGAGGLDEEKLLPDKVYWLYSIYHKDGMASTIASLKIDGPALPSGYIDSRMFGFFFTLKDEAKVQPFYVLGSGIDVQVYQQLDTAWSWSFGEQVSVDCKRVCPSIERMPVVSGVLTVDKPAKDLLARVLSEESGFELAGIPLGSLNVLAPVDEEFRAWFTSGEGMQAILSVSGGSFSRMV